MTEKRVALGSRARDSQAGVPMDTVTRAALSEGRSENVIHGLVRAVVDAEASGAKTLIDVGCGTGTLWRVLEGRVPSYIGCDVVRYPGFPESASFVQADLNSAPYPLVGESADVVACVETIEHLENPRMVVRELVRIVRPGGLVLLTTPNQLSFLSKLTLVVKNQFQAFQDVDYPAHITALVEQDLLRIARECGLEDLAIRFTDSGRIPGTARRWPSRAGLRGRWFSDNVLLAGRRPRS